MAVLNFLQRSLENHAEKLCHYRNQNTLTDVYKVDFVLSSHDVIFIQQHYRLDSNHIEKTSTIARLFWNESKEMWSLEVPHRKNLPYDEVKWGPYPFKAQSLHLDKLLDELRHDPQSYFWS
ncbi:DUF3024 domain-containing protein [Vibrio sp.]|nr:DUF3024 domain-containing protein [Vibrio sp.]